MTCRSNKIKLGDIITHKKGYAFKSKDYQKNGIPVVRVTNFSSDSIDSSSLYFVSKEVALANKNVQLKKNDIVIATVGSWPNNPASIVGKTIRVPAESDGSLLNQNAVILRHKSSCKDDQLFLYYSLKNSNFRNYIISKAQGSANQASITLNDIFNYELYYPIKEDRKNIAKFLNDIDLKISLNYKINQNLEEIAQAIFKSWFVDFEPVKAKAHIKKLGGNSSQCEAAAQAVISGAVSINSITEASDLSAIDKTIVQSLEKKLASQTEEQRKQLSETADLFPDNFVKSKLGLIPNGWKESTIGNEVFICGGGTPSTKNTDFWENGIINWATPKDLSGSNAKIILDTDRKISEAGLKKISSGLLPTNTVLLSSRAPIGYLAITKIPIAINQGYIAMKCFKELSPEFVLQWASFNMDEIKLRASGTTFAEISKKNFKIIPVIVPEKRVQQAYSNISKNIYHKITESLLQINNLSEVRDSLLPKLLEGELVVNEICKSV
ncbi:MAG: restriction endonuclease subunit S [Candidatus Muiribacteriota bacterium]